MTWEQVDEIASRFNSLNPYNRSLVPELLKIEDVNYVDGDKSKPRRQIFGYAVSAKRYALFTQNEDNISIVKASGHGLGYLYSPKTGFNKEAGAPEWIVEAWNWLLRNEFGLPSQEPAWLDYPAMMRMALTSPKVMQGNRPEWLLPFNFFLMPLLSDLDGYPAGCDRSNFRFITRFESDREKWRDLEGVNIFDGQPFRMETFPNGKQDKVVPESLRLMLRLYLRRPEWKSLSPDGWPCEAETRGLLKRASISAREIIPVSKETDRRWEQGEDLSLIDFAVLEYRQPGRLISADAELQTQVAATGLRDMMRRTGLSQHTIESVRRGQKARSRTLAILKHALAVKESC